MGKRCFSSRGIKSRICAENGKPLCPQSCAVTSGNCWCEHGWQGIECATYLFEAAAVLPVSPLRTSEACVNGSSLTRVKASEAGEVKRVACEARVDVLVAPTLLRPTKPVSCAP